MSIYVNGRLVINDAEHERVFTLIIRAARFGPYFWLAILAACMLGFTVKAATGSWVIAWPASFVASAWLGILAVDADREHVVSKWLSES